MPLAPISWGELIDKVTILEIKAERLTDPAALANVRRELTALKALEAEVIGGKHVAALKAALAQVNATLWDVEDAIRAQEARSEFGAAFVDLARSVYRHNDRRAALKREINVATASDLVEEKSYASYRAP